MTLREMTRADILQEIGSLQETCRKCVIRKEMERTYGKLGQYAKIDGHCNKNCSIGAKLQELGRHLGRGITPAKTASRQQRREWMQREDA